MHPKKKYVFFYFISHMVLEAHYIMFPSLDCIIFTIADSPVYVDLATGEKRRIVVSKVALIYAHSAFIHFD